MKANLRSLVFLAAVTLAACSGGSGDDASSILPDSGTPTPTEKGCGDDYRDQTTSCGDGVCAAIGTTRCVDAVIVDSCEPLTATGNDEDCNGLDEDCDGRIDEGYLGPTTVCGAGICSAQGQLSCAAGEVVDSCVAGELGSDDIACDGFDDDCDDKVDEGFVASATSCGVGICASQGALTCQDGIGGDTCVPGPADNDDSVCNGLDDDCNGQVDEDYVPMATSCGVGVCQNTAERSCISGQETDTCVPNAPVGNDTTCNGLDDDCDGNTDESAGDCPEIQSIMDIQNGTVPVGSTVVVVGVVTADTNGTFWIQDPTSDTFAGIAVQSATPVTINDVVSVSGTTEEYFDNSQIAASNVLAVGSAPAIVPLSLPSAVAATEAYEGMLVALIDITTVVNPYDCFDDSEKCSDSDLWEVNDSIVVYDKAYSEQDWNVHKGSSEVTGVMSYRFERRRILPRNATDFGATTIPVPPNPDPVPAEEYWDGIDLTLSGQALIDALQVRLKSRHIKLPYGSLPTHYQFTDGEHSECPNGGIYDFYSTKCWDVTNKCGNYSQEGDCFNREHSWPKSWFNGTSGSTAYSDIVHVVPSDGYVNGRRSNLIFGAVSNPTYTSSNGSRSGTCDSPGLSGSCFEPIDDLKGDFARIYFYMATRYEGEFNGGSNAVSGADLNPATEALLRLWHAADPVSIAEQRRNDRVQGVQNSRNPYVDYPALVDQITDF